MSREQYGEYAYWCYGVKGKFTLQDLNDLPSVKRLTSIPNKDCAYVIVVINPRRVQVFTCQDVTRII